MCWSTPSRRVQNSCQQCSACCSRVFTAVGSTPSRRYLWRSASVNAVPLVVNASNSLACPVFSSDNKESLLAVALFDSHTLSRVGASARGSVLDDPRQVWRHSVGAHRGDRDGGVGGLHHLAVPHKHRDALAAFGAIEDQVAGQRLR